MTTSSILWWSDDNNNANARDLYEEAEAKLTIVTPPVPAELYFWAIQVVFYDASLNRVGAAHAGLQWVPAQMNSKGVNWGGYSDVTDLEMEGTVSDFPSLSGNANTRDYDWDVDTEYTFRIFPVGGEMWRCQINGVTIRDLEVPDAVFIADPAVFSEVFAECSAPSSKVKWRDFVMFDASDTEYTFSSGSPAYNTDEDCEETDVYAGDGYFWLQTNTTRYHEEGAGSIYLPPSSQSMYFNFVSPPESEVWGWPTDGAVNSSFTINPKFLPDPSLLVGFKMFGVFLNEDGMQGGGESDESGLDIRLLRDPGIYEGPVLKIGGFLYDAVEDSYTNYIDGVNLESPLTLALQDEYETYYEFPFTTGEEYAFTVTMSLGLCSIECNGSVVAEITLPELYVKFKMAELTQYNDGHCGFNRTSFGVGDLVADGVQLEELQFWLVSGPNRECSTWGYYVEDSRFWVADTIATRNDVIWKTEETYDGPQILRLHEDEDVGGNDVLSLPSSGLIPLFSR